MTGPRPLSGTYGAELGELQRRGETLPETLAGEHRYAHYRRRGMGELLALRAALAWERNTAEQRARRLDHGTGATA